MKWYWELLGGHVHVRVFMNGGKCGDLCFREEEFQQLRSWLGCRIEFAREGESTYPRAQFFLWKTPAGGAMIVVDRDGEVSVTNDADAVVAYVLKKHPGKRIIYQDTEKQWAELRHDGESFTCFAPLTETELKAFSAI